MYFMCIHETILSLFLGFELSYFSSSNSIDSGYIVDRTPPAVLKLCRCFFHGLKICMCFWYFPEIIFVSFSAYSI